ncbi:MAG TPA: ABC transporter permease [Candidatus Latescibacteria bacterium]|nr:ABC transporter permease [Candidatus Latescibacterota bacterium]
MSRGFGDIYLTLFGLELSVMFQYRAAVVIWLLGLVLQPVVYMVVWLRVAEAKGGKVGDFDAGSIVAYFLVMMLVNHATFTWHMFEMGWRVRSGFYNAILVQPLHPWHRDVLANVAYKVLALGVILPVAALLAWYFEPTLQPPLWAVAAFVPAVILAFFTRFLFEWALGLLAFWITDTSGLNNLYMAFILIFSGRLAPLDLLPPILQTIAAWSPFEWMVAFPVELLLGRLTPEQTMHGLAMQVLWIAIGFAVMQLTWVRASSRYSAVGA